MKRKKPNLKAEEDRLLYIILPFCQYCGNDNFLENSDFRFFLNENEDIYNLFYEINSREGFNLLKFIYTIGCFSKEKVVDKRGKETEAILAQKASSFLAQILKTEEMKEVNYYDLLNSMPMPTKANQEFFKFISEKDKRNNFKNLNMLLGLEKETPGIFAKVMADFERAKSYRKALDEKGLPRRISWKEAFRKFNIENEYLGITEQNEEIAKIFKSLGLEQEIFTITSNLMEEARRNNIPEYILGKPLKENINKKGFSYEWLNKYDPNNAILGLFCDSCSTVVNQFFGSNIAKYSIIDADIQNLVVRDFMGKIIGKGTMYLNREKGYGVINVFEINSRYKRHELGSTGMYNVKKESKEEKEREEIFKAFQRGVNDFVKEYNVQNPNNRLKQINVGAAANRLKAQIYECKEEEHALEVPSKYTFRNAEREQCILYEENQREIEKEIEER